VAGDPAIGQGDGEIPMKQNAYRPVIFIAVGLAVGFAVCAFVVADEAQAASHELPIAATNYWASGLIAALNSGAAAIVAGVTAALVAGFSARRLTDETNRNRRAEWLGEASKALFAASEGWRAKVNEANDRATVLRTQISEAAAFIEDRRERLRETQCDIETVQDRLAAVRADHTDVPGELTRQRSSLERVLHDVDTQYREKKHEKEALEKDLKRLQTTFGPARQKWSEASHYCFVIVPDLKSAIDEAQLPMLNAEKAVAESDSDAAQEAISKAFDSINAIYSEAEDLVQELLSS
jgi:predicted  nucleic acid-binding Zn-ribbon protein